MVRRVRLRTEMDLFTATVVHPSLTLKWASIARACRMVDELRFGSTRLLAKRNVVWGLSIRRRHGETRRHFKTPVPEFPEALRELEEHLEEFLEWLCSTASAGHGRAERLSVFEETLHVFEEHLSEFLGRLCLTASAGHGRAERLSVFEETLHEFEEHLSEFLGRLCLTASAGHGRAERLSVFEEHLSEFLGRLCSTASATRVRAECLTV